MGVKFKDIFLTQAAADRAFDLRCQQFIPFIRRTKQTASKFSRRFIAKENTQSLATPTTAELPKVDLAYVRWKYRQCLCGCCEEPVTSGVP
jgi:hypothetical protein